MERRKEINYVLIKRLAVCAVVITLGTGCTTGYWTDRGRDAKDVFNLTVGTGVGVKVRAGLVHAGALYYSEHGGLRGGQWHWAKRYYDRNYEGHLVLIGMDSFRLSNDLRRKGYVSTHSIITPPFIPRKSRSELFRINTSAYYTQIDCAIGLGYGARVGFNPGELLDLFLGFFGVDIFDDDLEYLRRRCAEAAGENRDLLIALLNDRILIDAEIEPLMEKADRRMTELLLPCLKSSYWRTRLLTYRLLGKLKDPIAAKALANKFGRESDPDCQKALNDILSTGYPGIVFDAKAQTCRVVPSAALKALIDARNAQVKLLKGAK